MGSLRAAVQRFSRKPSQGPWCKFHNLLVDAAGLSLFLPLEFYKFLGFIFLNLVILSEYIASPLR